MVKGKIICGFAGIGKSSVAKEKENWVDLESTPFKKNWDLYSDVAIHMSNNGYNVMLSCHKELRDILKAKGAQFTVVIPNVNSKQIYLGRYKDRGNTAEFIKLFEDNWEKFIQEIMDESETLDVTVMDTYYLSQWIDKHDPRIVWGVGQIITSKADEEVEKIFGTKVIIKRGTRCTVGADGFVYYQDGNIRPISKEHIRIDGYSKKGIASNIWSAIRYRTPINEEVLEDYDYTPEEFKEEIEEALSELGFSSSRYAESEEDE